MTATLPDPGGVVFKRSLLRQLRNVLLSYLRSSKVRLRTKISNTLMLGVLVMALPAIGPFDIETPLKDLT
jgi:hypothetical protein